MLRKRIVYGRPNIRNIIIFSSATLRIEFRLKVIGKKRGKKNGGRIHSSLRLTYGGGGS